MSQTIHSGMEKDVWEHVQVIKVTDETQAGNRRHVKIRCMRSMITVIVMMMAEVCEAQMVTLTNVATDPGSENCPTGWLKWTSDS